MKRLALLLALFLDLTEVSWSKEWQPDSLMLSTTDSASLRRAQPHRSLAYADSMADGVETKYSEYAQAWRYLGIYVDCSEVKEGEQEQQRRGRRLDEAGGDQEGGENQGENGDGENEGENEGENGDNEGENGENEGENNGEGENGNNEGENNGEGDEGEEGNNEAQEEEQVEEEEEEDFYVNHECQRTLLWAAYVDLEYEGNGFAYSMYNPETKKWDNSACDMLGTKDCPRMDCHLPNTRWKLLGFFKEEQPMAWMEALTYNQGTCSFSSSDNQFMMNSFDWMPQGCTLSEATTQNGRNIYYDLVPEAGGHMGIGLYSDERCSQPYHGIVSKQKATGMYNLDSGMQKWNNALDSFKTCQPCRTFDLSYDPSSNNGNNNEGEGEEDDEEKNDPNNGNFVCKDADGNSGVNQCLMFAQSGAMSKASLRDVRLATQQGTIVRSNAVDMRMGFWQSWGFLILSIIVFIMGSVLLFSVALKRKRISSSDEPLIKK